MILLPNNPFNCDFNLPFPKKKKKILLLVRTLKYIIYLPVSMPLSSQVLPMVLRNYVCKVCIVQCYCADCS